MEGQTKKKRGVGRPKAKPGKRTVTTTFSLPEELAEALEKAAEEAGMGKSEFLRYIIKKNLEK